MSMTTVANPRTPGPPREPQPQHCHTSPRHGHQPLPLDNRPSIWATMRWRGSRHRVLRSTSAIAIRHQPTSVRNRRLFDLAKRAARARLAWAVPASRRVTIADRVEERRRAVALARHFREEEDLSITQIADRLGRSPGTVKAYFYDPPGTRRGPSRLGTGICRGCGADTQPPNGKGDAYAYCKACRPGAIRRRWTSEASSRRCAGGVRSTDGCHRPRLVTHPRSAPRTTGNWAAGKRGWPAASVVTSVLGSWPAARARAESGVDEIRWKHEAPSLGDAE